MEKIFYNKKTSIAFVAAALVLILLVCILLITLTQLISMQQRVETLNAILKENTEEKARKEALLEYKKTDEYVIEWAIQHGRLSEDDVSWIKENLSK